MKERNRDSRVNRRRNSIREEEIKLHWILYICIFIVQPRVLGFIPIRLFATVSRLETFKTKKVFNLKRNSVFIGEKEAHIFKTIPLEISRHATLYPATWKRFFPPPGRIVRYPGHPVRRIYGARRTGANERQRLVRC